LDVLHVTHCDLRHALFPAEVDQLVTGFMQDIPLLTFVFGRCFSFIFEQLPLSL
jgi:hypothetical protein